MAPQSYSSPRHEPVARTRLPWLRRYPLWTVGLAPLFAQIIGSAFNIWYNLSRIQPLLTPLQHVAFVNAILAYNLTVYPIATFIWIRIILSLRLPFSAMLHRKPVTAQCLLRARQRLINLPWLGAAIASVSWLLCIPAFLLALNTVSEPLNPLVFLYLPVSLLISALIAMTHGFFAIEILSQWLLYPTLFRGAKAAETPGAFALSLRQRGLLLAISAGICPIISLLLLSLMPQPAGMGSLWFAIAVGGLGIIFGLVSAWMVGRIVVKPVEALQQAAASVAKGNLTTRIHLQRADEFGPLIDEFNAMVVELQEKQQLQETFGRHVGEKAAQQILQRDPNLGGVEQELTVLFADLRNFTVRCTHSTPQQVVTMLNLFLTEMVEIVEQRSGGMVNKFLGDGFMALFGVGDEQQNHAAIAVTAGQEMLRRLQTINRRLEQQGQAPLAMGIGIHTGRAVVGSIGSPQRLEYTAIGDTVNIAARIESLTKLLNQPLLMTQSTRAALPAHIRIQELPPQPIKGKADPLVVYCLRSDRQPD